MTKAEVNELAELAGRLRERALSGESAAVAIARRPTTTPERALMRAEREHDSLMAAIRKALQAGPCSAFDVVDGLPPGEPVEPMTVYRMFWRMQKRGEVEPTGPCDDRVAGARMWRWTAAGRLRAELVERERGRCA